MRWNPPRPARFRSARVRLAVLVGCLAGASACLAHPFTLSEIARLENGGGTRTEDLGTSVAIDGGWIAVGAPRDELGAVHVLERQTAPDQEDRWTETQVVRSGDANQDSGFGEFVGVSGTTLAVGCRLRSVYLFELDRGGAVWNRTQRIDVPVGMFHSISALALDGDLLAVSKVSTQEVAGQPNEVRLYRRSASGTWALESRLQPDTEVQRNRFGDSIAIQGDQVAVGAPAEGAVYLFERQGGTWRESQRLALEGELSFGLGASVHFDGDRLGIGSGKTQDPISGAFLGSVAFFERGEGPDRPFEFAHQVFPRDLAGIDEIRSVFALDGDLMIVHGSQGLEFDTHLCWRRLDRFGDPYWEYVSPATLASPPGGLSSHSSVGAYQNGTFVQGERSWSAPDSDGGQGIAYVGRVRPHPDAPVFASSPPSPAEVGDGESFRYEVQASNPGGQAGVSLSGDDLPAWLDLSPEGDGAAVLSGTPPAEAIGLHTIRLVAEGPSGLRSAQSFVLTVIPRNVPPEILLFSADPQLLTPGQLTTLRWDVLGADSLTLQPAGLPLDPPLGSIERVIEESAFFTLEARNGAGLSTAEIRLNTTRFGEPIVVDDPQLRFETTTAYDYDGDGDQDLLTLWLGDDLSWYPFLGKEEGFGERVLLQPGNFSVFGDSRLHKGDVDGDGDVDLVVGCTRRIQHYRSLGPGAGYAPPREYAGLDLFTVPIDLMDGNKDGGLDIFLRHGEDLSWMPMTRNGFFEPTPRVIASRVDPWAIAHADFDRDGLDDLVFAHHDTRRGHVSWVRNLGGGAFAEPVEVAALHTAFMVRTADVDGDGWTDVVASSRSLDKIVWFRNDSSGGWEEERLITDLTDQPLDFRVVDLDSDGDPDVVAVSENDGEVSWMENLDAGRFGPQQIIAILDRPTTIETADFDGDNDPDLLVETLSEGTFWIENENDPPVAENPRILGALVPGGILNAAFDYRDEDNDRPGIHAYQWFRAEDASGAGRTDIPGATGPSYLAQPGEVGAFLGFEVIPAAARGTSPGKPVGVTSQVPVQRLATVLAIESVDPQPSYVGEEVTVSFRLEFPPLVPELEPSGQVTLSAPGTPPVAVDLPAASLRISLPRAGTQDLEVRYAGDPFFQPASTPLSHRVYSQVAIESAGRTSAPEDEQAALEVTLSRDGDIDVPLSVDLAFIGSAVAGEDYLVEGGGPDQVTFPAGMGRTSLTLVPVADNLDEEDETLGVRLLPGPFYSLADPQGSEVGATILDDDASPVAAPDPEHEVVEDSSLAVGRASGVLANDTDADDGDGPDHLVAVLVDATRHGELGLEADGSFTYAPEADFHGEDSFRYRASDGTNLSEPLEVTIRVTERVDLAVTATAEPAILTAPDAAVHSIRVLNRGPSDATSITIDLTVAAPEGVDASPLPPSAGAVVGTLWMLDLPEGESAELPYRYQVPGNARGQADAISTGAAVARVDQPRVHPEDDNARVFSSIVGPADVEVTLLAAQPVLDRQSGLLRQSITITNRNPLPIGSYRLLVGGLPEGVELTTADGRTTEGVPYVVGDTRLDPLQSVTLVLEFSSPGRGAGFTPVYTIESVFLDTPERPEGGDQGSPILRLVSLENGDMLLEFGTVAGTRYAVEYSSDMTRWIRATPEVVAVANRTQWIDSGPPKTGSHPSEVESRYYRVVEADAE